MHRKNGKCKTHISKKHKTDTKCLTQKVYISHGKQDSVLQVQYAYDAIAYLKSKGINPEFHEYSDGHTVSETMLSDVNKWLK